MCTVDKQRKLHSFISYNKIDIILLQEHNAKSVDILDYLADFFTIYFNPTIALKGGTAILIDKRLDTEVSKIYLHPSSRITKIALNLQGYSIDLFCVYAHSGNNVCREREEFFEKELLPLIRNKSDKVIVGGDWNSIISDRDCSNPRNSYLSKNLKNIVQNILL